MEVAEEAVQVEEVRSNRSDTVTTWAMAGLCSCGELTAQYSFLWQVVFRIYD